MRPVTAWHRLDRARFGGSFAFNHIEDGHATTSTPADPFQRGWASAKWWAWHGHLVEGGLVLEPLAGQQVVPISEPRRYTQ